MPKIIVKEPGKEMRVENFDGKYRCDVRPLLGEDVTLEYVGMKDDGDTRLCMVLDEDGKIKRLPRNFLIPLNYGIDTIVGTVCIVRFRWENPWEKELWDFELMDVTPEDVAGVKNLLSDFTQGALVLRAGGVFY